MKQYRIVVLGGGAAGIVTAMGAAGISAALAHWVFRFPWQPPWLLWPAALLAAALLAVLAGWWSLRGVLRKAPGQSLRALG